MKSFTKIYLEGKIYFYVYDINEYNFNDVENFILNIPYSIFPFYLFILLFKNGWNSSIHLMYSKVKIYIYIVTKNYKLCWIFYEDNRF